MRKKYVSPKLTKDMIDTISNEAAPLAFFTAATAAAAVGGAVLGAVAAAKALGRIDNQTRNAFNQEIMGLCA